MEATVNSPMVSYTAQNPGLSEEKENGESWAHQPRTLGGGQRVHRLWMVLAQSCMLQMELCPPNSYVEALPHNEMVLGEETFGR